MLIVKAIVNGFIFCLCLMNKEIALCSFYYQKSSCDIRISSFFLTESIV